MKWPSNKAFYGVRNCYFSWYISIKPLLQTRTDVCKQIGKLKCAQHKESAEEEQWSRVAGWLAGGAISWCTAGCGCCWWCPDPVASHTRRRRPGAASEGRARRRSASRTAVGCGCPAPTATPSALTDDHTHTTLDVDVDVDGVYERRPRPLCRPHLITLRFK